MMPCCCYRLMANISIHVTINVRIYTRQLPVHLTGCKYCFTSKLSSRVYKLLLSSNELHYIATYMLCMID